MQLYNVVRKVLLENGVGVNGVSDFVKCTLVSDVHWLGKSNVAVL